MPSIREHIDHLNRQVIALYEQGLLEEALKVAPQACELARYRLGENDIAFGSSLNNLALVRHATGSHAEAESLFLQALEVFRHSCGEKNLDFARCLTNLGMLFSSQGNTASAEPCFRRALNLLQKIAAYEQPEYVSCLHTLTDMLWSENKLADAESLLMEARDTCRMRRGEQNREYAAILYRLARVYEHTRNFSEAESLLCQALEIVRSLLGEEHLDVARCQESLAEFYLSLGNLAAAEALFSKVAQTRLQILGPMHPEYALSLGHLAWLHHSSGNFRAAEPLYRQALDILRQTPGEEHPAYAHQLGRLGTLLGNIHNYEEASSLLIQASEILLQTLGETDPRFAASLHRLGALNECMWNLEDAKWYYGRSLEVLRQATEDPGFNFNLTECLSGLARVSCYLNDFEGAETLIQEVLEIRQRIFGKNHPSVADTLDELAGSLLLKGEYEKAEPLLKEALEIYHRTMGKEHHLQTTVLGRLSRLYQATGRGEEALSMLRRANSLCDRLIGQVFSMASESQRMVHFETIQANVQLYLSLITQQEKPSPEAVCSALDTVLRRKAILAEALAVQRETVLGGQYPGLEPRLRELTALRMHIARKTLGGLGVETLEGHEQQLVEWNQQKERLEAELARQIPEIDLEKRLAAADRRAVALRLPKGSVLVEFVHFYGCKYGAVPARGETIVAPPRYVVFVLSAGEPDNVRMIDLGEAEPVDRMIRDFRVGITGQAETLAGRDLGAVPTEPVRAPGVSQGLTLRAAVFDKLVPALSGCKRLLLASDGDLSLLPFEVLPTADGRCLIDEYQISYVATGRDVLRFGAVSNRPTAKPLVVADPDFDLGNDRSQAAAPTNIPHGWCSRDLDRGLRFGRLKGTRLEGERIAALLGVKPWVDATALERRLKACRSPRILHLATHGFFLTDQKRDPNQDYRDLGAMPGQESGGLGRLSGSGLQNPLLRSGLALAGANTWLQNGKPPAEAEDGLLTAEDVSGLDLLDTDLVVLSACETGLGEIHIGEGVFGLRRAFVLAGAKTLVMSLWKVPDKQTQELMEEYYCRLLDGQPRAEALRQAQLALKARYPNPLFWGAFICQGDPAPLPLEGKLLLKQANPATAKTKWLCPGCGKAIKTDKQLIGKKVKCPRCGNVQFVPTPEIRAK